MAHLPVKPEKIVGTVAPLVTQELVLPKLFRHESLEKYKGSKDDTLTFWVPGNLPAREYAWRNNRSSGIVFDEYAETKVTVTAGGNAVSAVKLTDEQSDMDFNGWTKLLDAQGRGVAAFLARKAAATVAAAPYEVTLKNVESDLKGGLIRARGIQNRFGSTGSRVMVIGTDFEEALLSDEKLNLASNVGDSEAQNALREATIGRRYGYTFVVDQSLPPGDAYAFGEDAFMWVSMVPGVPLGVAHGATTSSEGVAMRWICDYDPEYLRDRSIVNTYFEFRAIKDNFKFWDESADPDQETTQETQYFVRAIKLQLGGVGADVLPDAGSDVAKATGVSD